MMSWTAVHDALTDIVVARELVTLVPKYIFSTSSGGRTYYYDRASLVQISKEYAAIKNQALRANFSREKYQENALLARVRVAMLKRSFTDGYRSGMRTTSGVA